MIHKYLYETYFPNHNLLYRNAAIWEFAYCCLHSILGLQQSAWSCQNSFQLQPYWHASTHLLPIAPLHPHSTTFNQFGIQHPLSNGVVVQSVGLANGNVQIMGINALTFHTYVMEKWIVRAEWMRCLKYAQNNSAQRSLTDGNVLENLR